MAKVHGKNFAVTFNSVALATAGASGSLSISVDTAEITVSSSAAKEFLEGDYTATHSLSGPADFGTSLQDATLFAAIGGGGASIVWGPATGTTTTTNPNYTQTAILTGYTLNFGVGDAVNYSADWQGTGAVTRTTS